MSKKRQLHQINFWDNEYFSEGVKLNTEKEVITAMKLKQDVTIFQKLKPKRVKT